MTQSGRQEGARGNRRVPRKSAPMRASAAARRGPAGETGFPPRDRAEGEGGGVTFVLAATGAALGPLRPLLREHERLREVRVVVPGRSRRCCEAAAGAEGLLLVDDRRRAPRTALPGPVPRRPVGASGAGRLAARPRLRAGGVCQGGGPGPAPVRARRAARGARAVGAALPPARRASRGEPQPWRRTAVPGAPLDVRADHAGRPRPGTAARARRRHLLRPRPAVRAGPDTTASAPATSWRREASRSARSSR